jgi:two-component system NtrC family sensor kinase
MTAILIVEDQLALLAVTGAFLAEKGYGVSAAPTAASALTLLETRKIDVLLTDIVLPGEMNGFELARRARAIKPDLKVIYCTGDSELEPEQIGDAFGPLLKKPYANRDLTALLEYVQTCDSCTGENIPEAKSKIYGT